MKDLKLKILSVLIAVTGFTACSDDDLHIDEDLAKPQYVLPEGEPESLDALIYDIHERYGTYVLYDFKEADIRINWTTKWNNWYAPVKKGNEKYVRQMIEFVQKNLLEGYTDEFVRANLVYRIFMVDSLCTSSDYQKNKLTDLLNKEHAWVLSNIGPQLEDWTDADWGSLKNELISNFTLSFYEGAAVKPLQFTALKEPGLFCGDEKDPEGKYGKEQYNMYKIGYVKWRNTSSGTPNSMCPKDEQDFADYITFLTTTPATELSYVLKRFERVKERALVLVPYLDSVLHLNVITTQNKNCPEDMISADFFVNL